MSCAESERAWQCLRARFLQVALWAALAGWEDGSRGRRLNSDGRFSFQGPTATEEGMKEIMYVALLQVVVTISLEKEGLCGLTVLELSVYDQVASLLRVCDDISW